MSGCVLAIGTKRDDQEKSSAATMRISACEDLLDVFGIWTASALPGAQIRHQARKEVLVLSRNCNAVLAKMRSGWSWGVQFAMSCLRNFQFRRARAHAQAWRRTCRGQRVPYPCKALEEQFCAIAEFTTQIIDEPRPEKRNARQQVARRAHTLGLELRVESRVPVGHQHEFEAPRVGTPIAQIEGRSQRLS